MIWDWLLASIDPNRVHAVDFEIAWHGRLMVFAWSFLIPMGIISARFFKILPKQDWPKELDSQAWWYTHLACQYFAVFLMAIATWLIWKVSGSIFTSTASVFLHHLTGWTTLALCGAQVLAGWFRGSKGGPTEVYFRGTVHGDHYDMTERRKKFERFHKTFGYICMLIALVTVGTGLWIANAANWMWLVLSLWWVFIIFVFYKLQSKGWVVDTYQAIWGNDPNLPGNQEEPIGWGITKK